MDNEQLLSWIVGVIGISGFLLAGRKVWWSWYVNIACQVFWVLYAIVSDTPAFLVTAAFYTAVFSYNAWRWTRDRTVCDKPDDSEESNFVLHARAELKLIGEEPDVIEWYVKVIREYASFGHSGGSHFAILPTLNKILNFENLSPLTDRPSEWQHHGEDVWGETGGVWQSRRNSEAFSNDGGKTYYLLDEKRDPYGNKTMHISEKHDGPKHAAV